MFHVPPSRRRVGARASLRLAVFAVAAVAQAACSPCDGVVGCATSPEARATIFFVRRGTGAPVGGVRVEFRPSDPEFAAPAAATSDGTGMVQFSSRAVAEGLVTGDLVVTPPPPVRPYTVRNLGLGASRVRGQGNVLGRWAIDLQLDVLIELRDRATGAPLAGATVGYRRLGGGGADPGSTTVVTNELGWIWLPLTPESLEPVIVEFVVTRAGETRSVVSSGHILEPSYLDDPPQVRGTIFLDPP